MAASVNSNGSATQNKEELAGFIFMCSGMTKPECYVNRVFGLPAGRRKVVEKIKPGTKLFLFDTDVKLLYGVYEAVSKGGMNLQPAAFRGRYPAQVTFKIYKDCLPLPVSTFRTAIKDNYQGSKFASELNDQQVRDLLLLFSPIVAPSSALLHPPASSDAPGPLILPPTLTAEPGPWARPPVPNATPALQVRPPASKWSLNHSSTRPSQIRYQPYRAGPLPNHSQQRTQPQFSQENGLNPHSLHFHPSTSHQALPVPVNPYQFAENRPPYVSNKPHLRYMTTPEVNHGGYNNGLALQPVLNHSYTHHQGHISYPMPEPSYDSSYLQTGPTYVQPQPLSVRGPVVVDPSMPVSTYYSFAGGLLR